MGKTAFYALILLFLFTSNAYAQGSELNLDQFDGLDSSGGNNTDAGSGWIVSDFISALQIHTYNFVKSTYGELAAITHNYFIFFTSIWFIYIVITVFFLRSNTPPMNILMQLFLIMLASTLLTSGGAGAFFSYFYEPIVKTSVEISGFFMGKATNTGDNFSGALLQLENLFKNSFKISAFMIDSVSGFDIGGYLKAVFLSLCLILAVAGLVFLFAAYWSYSIFALHILFAVTPFMIALYPFKALRQYSEKWFSGVINYALLPILLSISMGITILIYNSQVAGFMGDEAPDFIKGGQDITGDEGSSITFIILVSVLSFLVHLRIGDIAAHLTGGISTGLGATWAMGIGTLANVGGLGMSTIKGQNPFTGNTRAGVSAKRGIATDRARDSILEKAAAKAAKKD